MDTYEVAAIGDLYKKNTSGRKTWNLREFALTGVQLIYYKKGMKRGEWDISGCKVRKITPEEAQQAAAKFAFAIEGNKKQFMLSANNEKNRELWISVLEKQIHEFRNPVRRFIRTGEIVHANGFVKKGNMFGKTPILLVVTNYPRIIEIDPATIELKDQYSWVPSLPPIFTKLSETKLKIMIGGKELRFEDPANGMVYWEALFQRLHRIELWQPSKQPTLRIGFPGGNKPITPRVETKKSATPETSKDLKFLEEAHSHIQELLQTLNNKIEEIDMVFVMAVHEGHESAEEQSAAAQDRQTKRSQLLMLKENIDVIADNLKSLITRSKNTGSALFDVAAIESVISEAATLLILLNSDDDEDNEVNQVEEEEFIEEVKEIDNMVAQIENEVNTATSSSNEDSSVSANPITELDLSASVFDPKNPKKRPEGWTEVRMKRVLKREQADRENGMDEETVIASRPQKEREEEAAMLAEVVTHGTVLGLKAGGRKRSATLSQDAADLDVNADNFDAPNPAKRPPFWAEVRTKRVMLKEHIDRIGGVSESVLVDKRPIKEIDEEMTLVGEVLCFGRLLNVAEVGKNPSTHPANVKIASPFDPSKPRPAGWNAAKATRVMLKELEDRLNGDDEKTIKSKNAQKLKEEEDDMVAEAKENGFVTVLGTRVITKKFENNEEAMDQAVKNADLVEMSSVPLTSSPSAQIEEPVQYKDETINFGSMSLNNNNIPEPDTPKKKSSSSSSSSAASTPVTRNRQGSVEISKSDISKHTGQAGSRPPGWAEIKLRRVYLKEWEDRKNGVDEDDILDKRYARELEAEQEMIAELGVRGKIALFEKGGIKSKPVKKFYKKEDLSVFMAASSASMNTMNEKISKLVVA